ncbi:MAG: AAA family ATPase [Chromatiales bacterium]|nr:AAA family ATPase [Chromatiales bacterium]
MASVSTSKRPPEKPAATGTDPASPAPARPSEAQPGSVVVAFRGLAEKMPGSDPRRMAALQTELKYLKRALIKSAFGPLAQAGANLISISSAMPGAGKTFLTMQLGLSLALERDRRVLLIDADNARGSLTRLLGLRGQPGFYDVLHDPALDPAAAILPTDCPALRVMPAGKAYSDSVELVNSQRARAVAERLLAEDPHLLVLLDGPPLMVSPDASALAGLAGQVLMIVEAGETTEDDVQQALQLIDEEKPVGLVLNKIPNSRLLAYRGGYYYYGAPEPGDSRPGDGPAGHG